MPRESPTAALTELVANLQGQIESLAAQVRKNTDTESSIQPPTRALTTQAGPGPNVNSPFLFADTYKSAPIISQVATVATTEKISTVSAHNTFFGPTCPDYSLNMAQLRLRQGGFSKISQENPNLASTDYGSSEDEEPRGGSATVDAERLRLAAASNQGVRQRLVDFRNLFALQEAIPLLYAYQEVVGEYHPILAIDQLVQQVEGWYSCAAPEMSSSVDPSDENTLVIINIVLSIALYAESNCPGSETSNQASLLYLGFCEVVNGKIMCSAPSIKQVVITLLMVSPISLMSLGVPLALRSQYV
jgi:hypothetical protein